MRRNRVAITLDPDVEQALSTYYEEVSRAEYPISSTINEALRRYLKIESITDEDRYHEILILIGEE